MSFKMEGFDDLQKRFKDLSNLKNIPAKCPLCEKDVKVSKGMNRCPHCNKEFKFKVD